MNSTSLDYDTQHNPKGRKNTEENEESPPDQSYGYSFHSIINKSIYHQETGA